jgi:hypothetical protein
MLMSHRSVPSSAKGADVLMVSHHQITSLMEAASKANHCAAA